MARFLADLHIHTALSPCAEREMNPPAIVAQATQKGLSMIAICDHNTAANARAVQEAAARVLRGAGGLTVIAGMEITTVEEAHVVGLFPDAKAAEAAASEVKETLPLWKPFSMATREPEQEVLDCRGQLLCREERMLNAATRFTLKEAVALIRRHGGLAVAAHVDRRAFSVPGQLGFFPDDVVFDALEISAAGVARGRAAAFVDRGVPLISSSDSHFLSEIGASETILVAEEGSFAELLLAIHGQKRSAVRNRERRTWGRLGCVSCPCTSWTSWRTPSAPEPVGST